MSKLVKCNELSSYSFTVTIDEIDAREARRYQPAEAQPPISAISAPAMAAPTKAAIDEAVYLDLRSEPISPEAIAFVDDLAVKLWTHSGPRVKSASKEFKKAVGTLVADLFKVASHDPKRYGFRGMRASDYPTPYIGYAGLTDAIKAMRALGYLEVIKGYQGSRSKGTVGRSTRLRVKRTLLDYALTHKIDLADWAAHFRKRARSTKIAKPLILKSPSKRFGPHKEKGASVPIVYTNPRAVRLAKQVDEINAFMARQIIDPDEHLGFQRIFNQRNNIDQSLEYGGRLYSIGGGYQQMAAIDRKSIKINNEATVEIDIKASHPTILHAKLGISLHRTDPYDIPGIPRKVVKAFVTMTLGHNKYHKRWSADTIKQYKDEFGRKLGNDYPIKKVRETILRHLPALRNWESCSIRWGDLQYMESCAIIDAVHSLAINHNVAALPVHDSIIVPASQRTLADIVLKASFKTHIGVEPKLEVSK
jgi:hypothetical protein